MSHRIRLSFYGDVVLLLPKELVAARTSLTENQVLINTQHSKRCYVCRDVKPLSEFGVYQSDWSGSNPGCKVCETNKSKDYYRRNKARVLAYRKRKAYGITAAEELILIKKQRGLCGICSKPFSSSKATCVDHSHDTKKIRGLLCTNCNFLLGHAKDNIAILNQAIRYLQQ